MPKTGNKTKDIKEICNKLHKLEIAAIFGVAQKTIWDWTNKGCPRNDDNTYVLTKVIKWRETELKSTRGDNAKQAAELRKLENQNAKLELEIANLEKKTIPREKVEEIFKKAETEIRLFMTDGFKKNALEIWSKIKKVNQLQEFIKIYEDFFKQAMDVFVKSGEDIE